MSRSEYLMALYDALDEIPNQERTDAVSEYQEYFINEIEKGRTEEEICLSLGDPITLAYAIKQRRGYGAKKQRAFYEKPRRSHKVFKDIATVITVLVIVSIVLGGSMMFSFSRGTGMIFGIGKKYEINDIREINLDSAKTIIVRTISVNTSILPSDTGKIKSTLKGNVRSISPDYVPTLEVTKSGDSIIIEEKRKTFAIIGFNWEQINLDISVPKSFQGDIKYEGKSGDINIDDLEGSAQLEAISGNIKVTAKEAEDKIYIKASSGNIELKMPSNTGFTLDSKVSSGDIKCDFDLDIEDSGDHKLRGSYGNGSIPVNINTTSGNIDIEKR